MWQILLSTLIGMVMKLASKEMIKFLVIYVLDFALELYEKRAAKTPEEDDDLVAEKLRELLEKAKEAWSAD